MQIIIPMSGVGQRFLDAGYKTPKPLIKVDGKTIIEHVCNLFPKESNYIFICNKFHLRNTNMKKELLKLPFFGWGLSLEAPIAIDRSNPRAAIKDIMSQGLAYLSQGLNVLIFPEGTRVAVGEKGRYARSGAEMAIKAGVPLVPIAHNSGEHWLNKHFVKLPGTITVVIGDAINTEAHNNSKALCNQSEDWIEKTVSEISAGQYAELNPKEY